MGELASAPATLLICNDATEQNPLVAWQIRAAIRHHRSRLYIVDSREQALGRKARDFVLIAAGQEAAALEKLSLPADVPAGAQESEMDRRLHALRDALAGENDLVVLFGAAIQGPALVPLRQFAQVRAALGKRTRFMALGDYANSRGAADMGVLPDFLPGYGPVSLGEARELYGQLWGAKLPEGRGLDSRAMVDAAVAGKLKALYVVGANPAKKTNLVGSQRFGKLELLIVQDLYLSETARLADIVLPALSGFEKSGTMTNTAGEVQLVRAGADFMGPRTDLRYSAHPVVPIGAARIGPADSLAHARRSVRGDRQQRSRIRRLLDRPADRGRRADATARWAPTAIGPRKPRPA